MIAAFFRWLLGFFGIGVEAKSPSTPVDNARGISFADSLSAKKYFFSSPERDVALMLEQITVGTIYRWVPKCRLLDLVNVSGDNRNSINGTLKGFHLDFVILKNDTFQIVAALEIDGKSHANERQKSRDRVKTAALEEAKIPLVRLPNGVTLEQLKIAVLPLLK
jgi:hypothetical protein